MSARRHLLAFLAALLGTALFVPAACAQTGTITTVAGGGPNNLPKLAANLDWFYPAAGIVQDSNGNFYAAVPRDNRIYKISAAGTLTILAGTGSFGYSGDGGPATSAQLYSPEGVAVDAAGNVFIADTDNSVIREVVAATGKIQTVAGNGTQGYSGDGMPATSATLDYPQGVFLDSLGNIFIADTYNSVIREVFCGDTAIMCSAPAGFTAGDIYTVAGGGAGCDNGNPIGDGCPATSATLSYPYGVSVDGSGNYFIADEGNEVIREVTAATGKIQTIAGTPGSTGPTSDGIPAVSALLDLPAAVFVDGAGNLFISEEYGDVVQEVVCGDTAVSCTAPAGLTAGYIYTVAGQGEGCAAETDSIGDGCPATSAELFYPAGVFVDGSGNLFIADSNQLIREVYCADTAITCTPPAGMTAGEIEAFAGNGFYSFSGDGYAATDAALDYPLAVSPDASGDLYIADSGNGVIREVNASTLDINTVAGSFSPNNYECNDPPPTGVPFCYPGGVFVDGSGNLFVADTSNRLVWEVPAGSGQIQVVAGLSDDEGTCNDSDLGDGCPATMASLDSPEGIFVDASGNLFIADTNDSVIREVYCVTLAAGCTAPTGFSPGYINTVAGTPENEGYGGDGGPATAAHISYPNGVFVDRSGDIFIADTGNAVIREVQGPSGTSPGTIQTVAGTPQQYGYSGDGGSALSATTSGPYDVAVDAAGNIFFTDCGVDDEGCNSVVREVVATTGDIQTVAGNGTEGFGGDGGAATSAELDYPSGLAFDAKGNVLIADSENYRVRSVAGLATVIVASVSPATVPFGNVPVNTSSSMSVMLTNEGLFPLTFSSAPNVTGNSDFTITASTCMVGTPTAPASVAPGGSCTVTVTFKPSTAVAESATLNFADNAMPAAQSVMLTGTGTQPPVPAVTLAPPALAFGVVPVGMSSTLNVTVTNSGTGPLTFSNATITGTNLNDFAIVEGTTCQTDGGQVAVGASCIFAISFTPSVATPESATLTITDNAANSPQTVSLTGGGPGFTLTVPPPPSGGTGITISVLPGDTAIYTLALTCTPGVVGTVTLAEVGQPPPNTILTITPSMITCPTNGTVLVMVKLQTNCTAQLFGPRDPVGPLPFNKVPVPLVALWAGGLLLMGVALRRLPRRMRASLAAVVVLLALAATFAACVSNLPPAIPNAPTTPAGTYQITIVGTGPTGAQVPVALGLHVI